MPKPKPLPATLEHVSRLEDSIDRFVTNVGIEFNKLYNLQTRSEAEFRAFRDEMRLDREEARRERREMNRRWGDLANRLGTARPGGGGPVAGGEEPARVRAQALVSAVEPRRDSLSYRPIARFPRPDPWPAPASLP